MARPERFELPTSWFVARRSIQLSYGRARGANITTPMSERHSNAVSRVRGCPGGRYPRLVAITAWRRGREGLTRAFGPRPTGDACASSKIAFCDFVEPHFLSLGFESSLRGYGRWLNENHWNLLSLWRRGRDSNPRWAFDPYALSRGAPSTTRPPLRSGH